MPYIQWHRASATVSKWQSPCLKEVQEKTKASIELHICFLGIEGTLGLHYSTMTSKFLAKLIQKEE